MRAEDPDWVEEKMFGEQHHEVDDSTWVWCPECGGGGCDAYPSLGICHLCGGAGELEKSFLETLLKKIRVDDILQCNWETASDLAYQASLVDIASQDGDEESSRLLQEAEWLVKIVGGWFKELASEDIDQALAEYDRFGPKLENVYVEVHTPADA